MVKRSTSVGVKGVKSQKSKVQKIRSVSSFLTRPRSSWSLYLKQTKVDNPEMKLMEIVKLASAKWPGVDKTSYEAAHQKDLAEYRVRMGSLNEDEKRSIRVHRKKLRADPNRKKRAPTSYMKFIASHKYEFSNSDLSMIDFSKTLIAKWHALTPAEKSEY
jgi:hypothetical protein